jgi:hypothetical protein
LDLALAFWGDLKKYLSAGRERPQRPDKTKSGFSSMGIAAACHAFHPPMSARARFQPARLSSRATRALVASSGQAQKATIQL